MNWNRRLSLIVVIIYCGVVWARGTGLMFIPLLFLVLPLGCIWSPEPVGRALHGSTFFKQPVTEPTPAAFVLIGGWLLLLLPAVIWILDKVFA